MPRPKHILLLLSLLASSTHLFSAAEDAPISIDQISEYKQQRNCALRCFVRFNMIGYPIAGELTCPTNPAKNDCFCREDLQPTAVSYISSCVNFQCSSVTRDITVATGIYKDYCTSAGYTVTAAAGPVETGKDDEEGALTVTVTRAMVTVVKTVTAAAVAGPAMRKSSNPASTSSPPELSPTPNPGGAQTTPPTRTTKPPQDSSSTNQSSNKDSHSPSSDNGDDDSSSSKKLNTGEIVGIVVGALALLVAVVTMVINWQSLRAGIVKFRPQQGQHVPAPAPLQMQTPQFVPAQQPVSNEHWYNSQSGGGGGGSGGGYWGRQ
ncbi:hypothetical protein AJ80_07866 [Polytolypa hystricis UAMH7299]|uniref:Extracellular membrane protein CFEM domain-containing protein n=1 Tax=Polytolypa hystricis (strain UAMH7299) TaxID=1447883 RepID=A0A2B7XIK2_POLH7|nr:hypothetical protein AJ80_07866 [Polytolypa hystricis UAMH7299]